MPNFSKKDNTYHHIYSNGEGNGYRVIFIRKGFNHYSCHKTLEEAILMRDEIMKYLYELVKAQSRSINMECRIRSRENTKNTPDEE